MLQIFHFPFDVCPCNWVLLLKTCRKEAPIHFELLFEVSVSELKFLRSELFGIATGFYVFVHSPPSCSCPAPANPRN